MKNTQPQKPSKTRRLLWTVVVVLGLLLVYISHHTNKNISKTTSNNDSSKFPYRTIYANNDSGILYPYVLYESGSPNYYKECSAIIKTINPASDDYKTYCKSIISDIVSNVGSDNIEIYIYDDFETYEYSEVKLDQDFKGLSKNKTDSMDNHTVAYYKGDIGEYEDNYTLYFYPDAGNRYTENEAYKP